MTPQELKLECLKLASSYLPVSDYKTIAAWAQKLYDFASEQPAQATSDPETPYGVSYIAEAPTGAVSREWLHEKLREMLEKARREYVDAKEGTFEKYMRSGRYVAMQEVINLINPKKQ